VAAAVAAEQAADVMIVLMTMELAYYCWRVARPLLLLLMMMMMMMMLTVMIEMLLTCRTLLSRLSSLTAWIISSMRLCCCQMSIDVDIFWNYDVIGITKPLGISHDFITRLVQQSQHRSPTQAAIFQVLVCQVVCTSQYQHAN